MAVLALILFGIYFGVAFVARTVLQLRRTGDSGFRGLSGRPGTARWWAGILFAAAIITGLLGPVAALAGLGPVTSLDRPAIAIAATVVTVLGIVATIVTQYAMGASWRIGVDPGETTALVTSGPFALVRNPIFTAMAITGIGLALMVPNWIALVGAAALLVALHCRSASSKSPTSSPPTATPTDATPPPPAAFSPESAGSAPDPATTARRRWSAPAA